MDYFKFTLICFAVAGCADKTSKSAKEATTEDTQEVPPSSTDPLDGSQTQQSNENETTTTVTPQDVAIAEGVFVVGFSLQTQADLPKCDAGLSGKVALVLESMVLRYCKDSKWFTVAVKGDQGQPGPTGQPGPVGPAGPTGSDVATDYDYVVTESGNPIVNRYYKGGTSGTLVRTCKTSSTSISVVDGQTPAGTLSIGVQWGDAGCPTYSYEITACFSNYIAAGRKCIAQSSSFGATPPTCTFQQRQTPTGTCTNLAFESLPGNVCGIFKRPTRISAGVHFITCDVEFQDRLIIDPGAELRFDAPWRFKSLRGTYAVGTIASPIVITVSLNSSSPTFGELYFGAEKQATFDRNFHFVDGVNRFERVNFSERSGGLQITDKFKFFSAYLKSVSFDVIGHEVMLSQSVADSITTTNTISQIVLDGGSALVRSTLSVGGSPYKHVRLNAGAVALWNSGGSMSLNISSDRPALAAFNDLPGGLNCVSSTYAAVTYAYGNITPIINTPANCGKSSSNPTSAPFPSERLLFPLSLSQISASVGSPFALPPILYVDKDGVLSGADLHWTATSSLDGTSFDYGSGFTTNEDPSITFSESEYYNVSISTLDGNTGFLGGASVPVLVSQP